MKEKVVCTAREDEHPPKRDHLQSRPAYHTDLSDAEWTRLRNCLPVPRAAGRPRRHCLREIFDAIFYVLIPFRSVDGIMGSCQRYSTHR